MNEAQAKQKLVAALRGAGFWVIPHEDRYSKGDPDLSASSGGSTLWFEAKVVPWADAEVVAEPPGGDWNGHRGQVHLRFKRYFGSASHGHFRMQQLLKLQKLDDHAAMAKYAVCFDRGGKSMLVATVGPQTVLRSYQEDCAVLIYPSGVQEWARSQS